MTTGKFYAGIGSRETPPNILRIMESIAFKLAIDGWTLRSGGADGADTAFETGAKSARLAEGARIRFEIWLPWDGFNGRPKYEDTNGWDYRVGSDRDVEIAKQFHPAWDRLSQGAKKLHTRNVAQILGSWIRPVPSPDHPDPDYGGGAYDPYRAPMSRFVICWTRDGAGGGGTGQALRIAKHYGVPIFDLARDADLDRISRWLAR